LGTTLNLSGANLSGFSDGTYQVYVDETPTTPTFSKITLGTTPNLEGNTFKVLTTGNRSSFTPFDVFDWSGTASGTPTLNLNGTTVASGSLAAGGALTYVATSGVTLSASPVIWTVTQNGTTTSYITTTDANGIVLLSNAVITVANGETVTQSGIISGENFGFTLTGGGTFILTNTNTYTGSTTISASTSNANTLALSGSGSIASSSGVINNSNFDISATSSGASVKS
jgi:autotransporter-associated beta strand protein